MSNALKLLILLISFVPAYGQQAPNFILVDINGDSLNLYESIGSGKVVVLDFFFASCVPYKTYTPELVSLDDDYSNDSVEIWGISDRDDDSTVFDFRNQLSVTYSLSGYEGGGDTVTQLYKSWYPFFGWPSYGVVCTDTSIAWGLSHDIGMTEIRDAIDNCIQNGEFAPVSEQGTASHSLEQRGIYLLAQANENAILSIYDISGRLVMEQAVLGHEMVNLGGLHTSMYIAILQSNEFHIRKKIMIHETNL